MNQHDPFQYVGSELEIFERATNWRDYWSGLVTPFLGSTVLEVGAGIGSLTKLLSPRVENWLALEPDADLASQIVPSNSEGSKVQLRVQIGDIHSISKSNKFSSIIYADVLEHIESDKEQLNEAASRLEPNGYLIVMSPAHNSLFSEFDHSVGHFRRYNLKDFDALQPTNTRLISGRYLDSVGLLATTLNRFFLRSRMPTKSQVDFWDKKMIPLSRVLDPWVRFKVGKSALGIWQRD